MDINLLLILIRQMAALVTGKMYLCGDMHSASSLFKYLFALLILPCSCSSNAAV